MERANETKANITGRHPVYQVADKLKKAFLQLGFRLVDNGDGLEVEEAGVTFATWNEPPEIFGWQRSPLSMRQGGAILRTRLLPTHLRALGPRQPVRDLAFGCVYQNNSDYPMRHHIEGIVIDKGQTLAVWKELWQNYVIDLFGKEAISIFDALDDSAYKISVKNPSDGKAYDLGYTGPASRQAMQLCGASEDYAGWVFVIDVDQFARQYYSLTNISPFYENEVSFLRQFDGEEPAVGDSPQCLAIDTLRKLGYSETCGDKLYPDDAYLKMNMIQEAWDKNNRGYRLTEPLGELTATRTVIPPALQKILALNYARGVSAVRVFEVGHIFMPIEGQVLPKEHFAISMGAYGGEVTIDSFKKDVEAVLRAFGITFFKFIPTNRAPAYKWNESLIMIGKNGYLDSNFGRISEIAAQNHGIGVPAYMAQFELNTLAAYAKKR